KRHPVLTHPAYFAFHACAPALPDSNSIRHCSPARNGRLTHRTARNGAFSIAGGRALAAPISLSTLGVLL
ncbi:hypothetical protein KGP93_41350, partial [Burkholderia multivorans]|nr:hypothetical protein [Burkholderia multivorans]